MGSLEALDMLHGQSAATAMWAASIFSLLATLYAFCWTRRFRRGPLEALMRRVAG